MSHRYCPPGRKALRPILPAELPDMVGKTIHLSTDHSGAQFELVSVHGDEIVVSVGNGRNRRLISARASDAQYPRKSTPQTRKVTR